MHSTNRAPTALDAPLLAPSPRSHPASAHSENVETCKPTPATVARASLAVQPNLGATNRAATPHAAEYARLPAKATGSHPVASATSASASVTSASVNTVVSSIVAFENTTARAASIHAWIDNHRPSDSERSSDIQPAWCQPSG